MSISNIMFPSTTKLGQHHEVQEILGAGTYGDVAKCFNLQTQELEAVKVVKTWPDCIKNAQHEIEILKYLRRCDPDAGNIVRWNSFFFHKEMICLSFELLDCDLMKYILEHHNVSGTAAACSCCTLSFSALNCATKPLNSCNSPSISHDVTGVAKQQWQVVYRICSGGQTVVCLFSCLVQCARCGV